MESVGKAPPEEKRARGQQANELKKSVEAALAEREAALAAARRPAGAVDVTLPGRLPVLGARHPLSLVRDEVQEIFTRLGYQVLEGTEAEDDYHNFEALNMPPEHPARDMQDTLYLAEAISGEPHPLTLLRTHTSAMQIRHMEKHAPPVRLVGIGPVYRRDNLDLTHTPMFHQVEGLVVGSQRHARRPQGHADLDGHCPLRRGAGRPLPSELLPLHRAERRGRHPLHPLSGWRLRHLQAHRLARDSRQRHGASGRLRSRRLRPERGDRLRVRHGHRTRRRCSSGMSTTSACSTKTTCASWSSSGDEGPAVLAARVRRRARHRRIDRREDVAARSRPRRHRAGTARRHDDAVLDFDVTANRPDCLSIRGIAREVATAYELPLRVQCEQMLGSAEAEPHDAENHQSWGPASAGPGSLPI